MSISKILTNTTTTYAIQATENAIEKETVSFNNVN